MRLAPFERAGSCAPPEGERSQGRDFVAAHRRAQRASRGPGLWRAPGDGMGRRKGPMQKKRGRRTVHFLVERGMRVREEKVRMGGRPESRGEESAFPLCGHWMERAPARCLAQRASRGPGLWRAPGDGMGMPGSASPERPGAEEDCTREDSPPPGALGVKGKRGAYGRCARGKGRGARKRGTAPDEGREEGLQKDGWETVRRAGVPACRRRGMGESRAWTRPAR